MSQSIDRIYELRTVLTRVVRESTGLHERLALPVAEAIFSELQRRYGGRALYIYAESKDDRDALIRDAAAIGMSVDDIRRQFAVGKSTVYRALNRSAAVS